MGLLDFFGKKGKREEAGSGQGGPSGESPLRPCPNCGARLSIEKERCPECGVRIKSMFRRRCPKCGELNDMDAARCIKCGFEFLPEGESAKKTYYTCQVCGYKSEVMLTQCPGCNAKFI